MKRPYIKEKTIKYHIENYYKNNENTKSFIIIYKWINDLIEWYFIKYSIYSNTNNRYNDINQDCLYRVFRFIQNLNNYNVKSYKSYIYTIVENCIFVSFNQQKILEKNIVFIDNYENV